MLFITELNQKNSERCALNAAVNRWLEGGNQIKAIPAGISSKYSKEALEARRKKDLEETEKRRKAAMENVKKLQHKRRGVGSKKAIDLSGEKFGMLTALNYVTIYGTTRAWICKCDCGNKTVTPIPTNKLISGTRSHCGCAKKSKVKRNK